MAALIPHLACLALSTRLGPLPRVAPSPAALQLQRAPLRALPQLVDLLDNNHLKPPDRPMGALDAASIVAGTAIGGGFLALPAIIAPVGYLPSLCGLVGIWALLTASAVALVEAAGHVLSSPGNADASVSHAAVIRHAFGPRCANVCSALFVAQIVAIMTARTLLPSAHLPSSACIPRFLCRPLTTLAGSRYACAEIVQGARLFRHLFGVPYAAACVVPTVLIALFTFLSRAEVVEQANTALTATMLCGFACLVYGAIATGATGAAATHALGVARWSQLLPAAAPAAGSATSAWAVPVFLNLLCFTQSVPLIVQRLTESATFTATHATSSKDDDVPTAPPTACVRAALSTARRAVLLGSLVPLLMAAVWSAISTALVPPNAAALGIDPLLHLLGLSPLVGVPVALLAVGAIGTTLLSSFLSIGHFAADALCTHLGYCSYRDIGLARTLTVLTPCVLALAGPTLYLRLLAFAGAYPSAILYCVAPPIAALILRRRSLATAQAAAPAPSPLHGMHGIVRPTRAIAAKILQPLKIPQPVGAPMESSMESAVAAAPLPAAVPAPLPQPVSADDIVEASPAPPLRLLPGGSFGLVAVAGAAGAILGTSASLAARRAWILARATIGA